MAVVRGIYASTGGNTEIVMEKVADVLSEHGHDVTLERAELVQEADLTGNDLIIIGSPTYGHGQLQYHMIEFTKRFKDHSFKDQHFAVIGLGDDKYDSYYLVESARLLQEFIEARDGSMIHEPLKIIKSPIPHLASKVNDWAEDLHQKL
jgi:flavodoxin